ncbi:hypothetical protein SeMB42_g04710 [Synchytrium endobioticum]|uniref:mRNA export factor GLE1 n=1 Tax=Synchytrium endobioticum TaxID=286115 RepID=A0A507CWG7_9FUNG|nr:hypothetical protein SeMB42_g04710 [Synchytrium endobioticum]TPX49498.1 hypothetical protein SeLEV6574_g01406 [Synchytrium endobioticum]
MRIGVDDDTDDGAADTAVLGMAPAETSIPGKSPSKSPQSRHDRQFLKALTAQVDQFASFEANLTNQAWKAAEAKAAFSPSPRKSLVNPHIAAVSPVQFTLSSTAEHETIAQQIAQLTLDSQKKITERKARALVRSSALKKEVEDAIQLTQNLLAAHEAKTLSEQDKSNKEHAQAQADKARHDHETALKKAQQVAELLKQQEQEAVALKKAQQDAELLRQQEAAALKKAAEAKETLEEQRQPQATAAAASTTNQAAPESSSAMAPTGTTPSAITVAQPLLDLVYKIKALVKPELLSNLQNRKIFFQHKMALARRITVVKNAKSKVFEVGREIVKELEAGKAVSPQMYEVLMYKLARKITRQAELEASENPAFSFPLAFTAIIAMVKHEPFMNILLGHMMRRCPYIIPRYVEKLKDQSEQDYSKVAGYLKTDADEREPETKYIRRMCGIIHLYAAIIANPHPKNPHSIANGWTWLARIANIKPRGITPHLIHAFLKIAGNRLLEVYSTQAIKLVTLIRDHVIPAVPKEAQDALAASNHLLVFFERVQREGTIPKHEGSEWDT